MQSCQENLDLRSVYRVFNESFQDHWGYVERDEDEVLERWQHRLENDPDFDPSLWFLAMDGAEIAGIALCEMGLGGNPDIGQVDILGVRRPWRRQGLGLALLYHSFGEFYRRGITQVALGVDAESLTGATRLYEKAGMRLFRRLASYEKELRPGEELRTREIRE